MCIILECGVKGADALACKREKQKTEQRSSRRARHRISVYYM